MEIFEFIDELLSDMVFVLKWHFLVLKDLDEKNFLEIIRFRQNIFSSFHKKTSSPSPQVKTFAKKQQERIRFDEYNDRRIQRQKIDFNINLKSEWVEDMESTRNNALWKANSNSIKKEINNAHRALLKVRKAKLTEILENEKKEVAERLSGESGLARYESRVWGVYFIYMLWGYLMQLHNKGLQSVY